MRTKKCSMCGDPTRVSAFARHSSRKDGRQTCCKECKREYDRQRYKAKSKEYYNRSLRDRAKLTRWFSELKDGLACVTCGEDHNACLVFHHKDPKTKKYTVGRMIGAKCSKAKILAEIKKCIVLCANCHQKMHWP